VSFLQEGGVLAAHMAGVGAQQPGEALRGGDGAAALNTPLVEAAGAALLLDLPEQPGDGRAGLPAGCAGVRGRG
jgi:hypothetical protein